MTATTAPPPRSPVAALNAIRPQRSLTQEAWHRLSRNTAAMIGLAIIVFFAGVALFLPALAVLPVVAARVVDWFVEPEANSGEVRRATTARAARRRRGIWCAPFAHVAVSATCNAQPRRSVLG